MTQCIELVLLWEWDLAPKSQLSSQSPPAYIWSQGSFFTMYIIYLIFIWPFPLYHKVFLTSFLMPFLILSTLNTLMYWQIITSHCSSPFADCCWTQKSQYITTFIIRHHIPFTPSLTIFLPVIHPYKDILSYPSYFEITIPI